MFTQSSVVELEAGRIVRNPSIYIVLSVISIEGRKNRDFLLALDVDP